MSDSGGSIKVAGIGTYVSATDDITRNDTWNYNGTVVDKSPTTNITLSGGTHTVSCDVVGKSISSVYGVASGREYISADTSTAGNTTIDIVADTAYIMGFRLMYAGGYDHFTFWLSATGTATKIRVALYSVTIDGLLGGKLIESGDIAPSTAGVSTVTTFPVNYLPAGDYYLVVIADGTVTMGSQGQSANANTNIFGVKMRYANYAMNYYSQAVSSGWSVIPAISEDLTSLAGGKTTQAPSVALGAV